MVTAMNAARVFSIESIRPPVTRRRLRKPPYYVIINIKCQLAIKQHGRQVYTTYFTISQRSLINSLDDQGFKCTTQISYKRMYFKRPFNLCFVVRFKLRHWEF